MPGTQATVRFEYLYGMPPTRIYLPEFPRLWFAAQEYVQEQIMIYGANNTATEEELHWSLGGIPGLSIAMRLQFAEHSPRARWEHVRDALQGLAIFYMYRSESWVTAFFLSDQDEGDSRRRVWLIGQVLNENNPDSDSDLFDELASA